jgi:hypothetical protein
MQPDTQSLQIMGTSDNQICQKQVSYYPESSIFCMFNGFLGTVWEILILTWNYFFMCPQAVVNFFRLNPYEILR